MRRLSFLLVLVLSTIALAACGSGDGLPNTNGDYAVQSRSMTWDGDQYRFYWADHDGGLHQAHGKDLKLVQDDRSFLRVQDHHGTVHLQSSEPVTVLGQDRNGEFSNSWFPFFAGAAIGNALGGSRSSGYYYPPTDTFGRGDELHGSVSSSSPKPPDYSTVKPAPGAVQPAAGSVSGQNQGTGGGNAATGKLGGGQGSSSGSASGQSGGTGSGNAVSDKGGFRSGGSSYAARSSGSSGSGSSSGGSSGSKGSSSGSSGGKGISGAGSGQGSSPSRSGGGSRGRR